MQTGSVIWVDRFDGELADLFDLQDRIALRVATVIAPQLRERELGRALRKHPDSMTAYDLTLQVLDRSTAWIDPRLSRLGNCSSRRSCTIRTTHRPIRTGVASHAMDRPGLVGG